MNKFLRNRKGMSALPIVLVIALMIFVIGFFTDIVHLFMVNSAIAQTATEVARIGSVQGGFLNSKPKDYPGSYITISEMNEHVERKLRASGVNGDYSVEIRPAYSSNGRMNGSSYRSTGEIGYKEEFTVYVEADYDFEISRVSNRRLKLTSERIGMSEWKYYN